jgi:hypothetical protein
LAANERARAQRRLARQVRQGYQRQFEPQTRRARTTREAYVEHLLNHPEDITERDKKDLARLASYAEWKDRTGGKVRPGANPRWATWSEFFYHGSAGENVEYGEG